MGEQPGPAGIVILREINAAEQATVQQAMANGAQVWYHGAPDTAGANPLPVLADADQRQLNFAVMEALLAFPDLEVEGNGTTSTTNTTLRELFTADGVNSWYYHKFRVYFQVVEAYSLLHRLPTRYRTGECHKIDALVIDHLRNL